MSEILKALATARAAASKFDGAKPSSVTTHPVTNREILEMLPPEFAKENRYGPLRIDGLTFTQDPYVPEHVCIVRDANGKVLDCFVLGRTQ